MTDHPLAPYDVPEAGFKGVTLYLKGGSRENCEEMIKVISELMEGTEIRLMGDWEITRGSWVAFCMAKAAEIIPVGLAEHCWGKFLGLFSGDKAAKQATETLAKLTPTLMQAGDVTADLASMLLISRRDSEDRVNIILHQVSRADRLTMARHPELLATPDLLLAKLGQEGRVRFDAVNKPVTAAHYKADLNRTIQRTDTLRKLVDAQHTQEEHDAEIAAARHAIGGATP